MRSSSNFDQRLMLEYYGKSFENSAFGRTGPSYMTAYNQVTAWIGIWNQSIKICTTYLGMGRRRYVPDDGDLMGSSNPAYTTTAQRPPRP